MSSRQRWIEIAAVASLSVAASAMASYIGFSHVTTSEGSVSILSEANGRLEATVNAPINPGDRVSTASGARVEFALADGNRVQLDGESSVRLNAVAGSPESDARESVLTLEQGSLAVESIHSSDDRAIRVDTDDVSIYLSDPARVRVNTDSRQGTSVIVRSGTAEIETRAGSRTLSSGQYLTLRGDDEPEIAAGNFSRDRFDIWIADRTDGILEAHNSTAANFVDGDYDEDAAVMDSYGDWDYSSSYGASVWRPRVSSDWSPYGDGYWANTALGASWVSSEPWGWLPYHYGNWFFDSAFDSWCWAPAYVYSPAWVYWCYSPGWVGWCPAGYYTYSRPFRRFVSPAELRSGIYVSVSGIFNPGRIDFRSGWNFVNSERFGSRTPSGGIVRGSAIASRLSGPVAISSEPLRASSGSRTLSGVDAMRGYIAAAPGRIARATSAEAASAMAPFLARGRDLPNETIRIIQQSHIAAPGIGRASRELAGPGSEGLRIAARTVDDNPSGDTSWRIPPRASRSAGETSARDSWRERSAASRTPRRPAERADRVEGWREHSQDPPARRVIDGIERGHWAPRAERYSDAPPPPLRSGGEPRSAAPPRPEFHAPPPRAAPRPAPPPSGGDHPHGRARM